MMMNERECDWNSTLAEVALAPSPTSPPPASLLLSPQPLEAHSAVIAAATTVGPPCPSPSASSLASSSSPSHPLYSPSSSTEASSSVLSYSTSNPSITNASSLPLSSASSPSSSSLAPCSNTTSSTTTNKANTTRTTSSSSSSASNPTNRHPNRNPSPNTPLTPPPTPPTLLSPCQMTFREAVQNGDTTELQRLLEEREGKINVNLFDKEGQTALHHSCLKGNLELVKLLVRFGADVTLANRDGWHPLHLAASVGHNDILLYLLTVPRHRS